VPGPPFLAITRRDARRIYPATLRASHAERLPIEAPGRLPWWQPEPDRALDTGGGVERRVPVVDRRRLGADALITRARRHLGIDPETLAGAGKGREVSRLRYLIAAVGVERWGVGTKALAEVLGRRADAVTRWVHCGAERRQHDAAFRQSYDELDAALAGRSADAE